MELRIEGITQTHLLPWDACNLFPFFFYRTQTPASLHSPLWTQRGRGTLLTSHTSATKSYQRHPRCIRWVRQWACPRTSRFKARVQCSTKSGEVWVQGFFSLQVKILTNLCLDFLLPIKWMLCDIMSTHQGKGKRSPCYIDGRAIQKIFFQCPLL